MSIDPKYHRSQKTKKTRKRKRPKREIVYIEVDPHLPKKTIAAHIISFVSGIWVGGLIFNWQHYDCHIGAFIP